MRYLSNKSFFVIITIIIIFGFVYFKKKTKSENFRNIASVYERATQTAPLPLKISHESVIREFDPHTFGYNGVNFIRNISLNHPFIGGVLNELKPKLFRYPGGTVANYWDWKTGWFMDLPNLPMNYINLNPMTNDLTTLKKTLEAAPGAKVVWVLNMLNSSLRYQIKMLTTAVALGMKVELIELGNEFYASGADPSDNDFELRWPTGVDYALEANQWIAAIKAKFPDSKISIVGAAKVTNPLKPRRDNWNAEVLSSVIGADAITFHTYSGLMIPDSVPDSELFSTENMNRMLDGALTKINAMVEHDFPLVPSKMEAWITEYNLYKIGRPIHATWAHALYVGTATMCLAELPKVTKIFFHGLIGNAVFGAAFEDEDSYSTPGFAPSIPSAPATRKFALTAPGELLKRLSPLLNTQRILKKINFHENPEKILGWKFTPRPSAQLLRQDKTSEIILNLSNRVYQYSHAPATVDQLSSVPEFRSSGPGEIHESIYQSRGSSILIPAYSMTVLHY